MNDGQSCQPCGCDPGAPYKAPDCTIHKIDIQLEHREELTGYQRDKTVGRVVLTAVEPTHSERLQAAHPVDRKLWRKQRPVYSGVLAYFPDAIMEVAYVSFIGNEQHNPGQPLHWAREKSTDHLDCVVRHTKDHSRQPVDDDGGYHLAKAAWRAMAELQLYLEKHKERT